MSRYVKNCKVSEISASISYGTINVLNFRRKKTLGRVLIVEIGGRWTSEFGR